MLSKWKEFKQLHYTGNLLILPNAWDAKSAQLIANTKFPAIATSSMAVAEALGYKDGEQMSFDEYLFVIKRILATVSVPVTVDIEMGYGNNNSAIADNVLQLAELGVAGINIEDSTIQDGKRSLKDAKEFAATIAFVKKALLAKNQNLYINARVDTYLLNVPNKQQETSERLPLYEAAGADGIFLPFIAEANDITDAIKHTQLPINVMCMPGLPGFEQLQTLGVKRVSAGPFLFSKTFTTVETLLSKIMNDNNFFSII